ncbi:MULTISPECIES: MBL fold metallo-hydrolase [unclassified Massilia]|uniref:MBL fold metallo-hydrolase n=1 Tax=unclassified Massilia TaxID=2609279 RepID=UPI001784894A|nr:MULTISPECIES: MBL fold metallo-hydrolase [unclassified Massilia]MBD8533277.1 MBL fold metallo-hydrolase [Massilia sp. CFBP 13647]MBD8676665.1 MBL fold metallo-hydrolase [Massilia sp. CFBP 13721]
MSLLTSLAILGTVAIVGACAQQSAARATYASPQFRDGVFANPTPIRQHSLGEQAKLWWSVMVAKPAGTAPGKPVPVRALSRQALLDAPDNTMVRLGHSSVLLKLDGAFYLFDPMFSERASPVGFAGPKRYSPAPIAIDELPPIRAVILSHDHYDHLDHASILALAPKTAQFLAPLGVGDRLIRWGVDRAKVQQFDWWQETRVEGIRFAATPARHFSGRSLRDRNTTLWASWVVTSASLRLFFSGDSGYFDGFKAIGERYGPFDAALIETGAYDKQWPDVHMQPEQTLQAALDLQGATLVPIHNGTFDLALHGWQEPLERITALAEGRGLPLATPAIGEPLSLKQPHATSRWWRGLE